MKIACTKITIGNNVAKVASKSYEQGVKRCKQQ